MASVFITYRRSDSSSATGRIADRLQSHFGQGKIFYDIDTIPLGVDFRTFISDQLDKTDVFLVVIGDEWIGAKDAEGNRRIDDPNDWVRIEVSAALARENIPVIPVMVGAASCPPPMEELPGELADLSARNAIILRSDSTFEGQIEKLIAYIENLSKEIPVEDTADITQLAVGSDKDKVNMHVKSSRDVDKNSIRFSLSTAYDIHWWKAIKVFDKRGMISLLSAQDDDHGPKQSHLINFSDFGNEIKIEFHKAKTLGVHTHVDTKKFPASQVKGSEVCFTWLTDNK
ncbi:MAG: toll/interleukin-1 receptor domain-containing protein [Eudoraea sp.]|nr:toll/interleukin-1 receptor domain-containing protein [Eudoraea sp.]